MNENCESFREENKRAVFNMKRPPLSLLLDVLDS